MSQLLLFLVVVPTVGAAGAWLLARWSRWAALLGLATAVFVWLWLGGVEAGLGWTVWGYRFGLTANGLGVLQLLYGITAVLFGLAAIWMQGSHFVTGGLLALVAFGLALLAPTLLLGAFCLCAGLAILSMVMQADSPQLTPVAFRFFLFALLALPLFFLLDWLLASGQAGWVSRLFWLVVLLLLAGFPFFSWVSRFVAAAPLGVVMLVVGVGQTAVFAFLFQFLAANQWLAADEGLRQLLRWSGVATALVAGVLAVTATRPRALLGAIVLLDMGFSLLTLTFPVVIGWETAVMLLLVRLMSLLLVAVALQLLEAQSAAPLLCIITFAYGCLSLLGLPLTVGFGGRWVVITAVGQQAVGQQAVGQQTSAIPWPAILLLLATAAGTYGLFRLLSHLLTSPRTPQLANDTFWRPFVLTSLLLLSLLLAAFPQPLLAYAQQIATLLR